VKDGYRIQKKPVLFLIFNRPDLTFQSFETIRAARPDQLFISGDGPRPGKAEDPEKVALARTVVEKIDWDCKVRTRFLEQNLGCARAVSSGIDWAFESVEDLIILEDDCLPSPSFFPFCAELLDRFQTDQRVFVISGDNFQHHAPRTPYSYFFSRYNLCWGWATWKRAWKHFDLEMSLWPEFRDGDWLVDLLQEPLANTYWRDIFDQVHAGKIDTWDYQWTFACWIQSGLTILPSENLVQNIGFGEDATHTTDELGCGPPARNLAFPLSHPPFVLRDDRADTHTQQHHFGFGAIGYRDRIRHFFRTRLLRHL
jgi:hypothetical protein